MNPILKKIDYEYYEWLIEQIAIPNGKSYKGLFEIMHNTDFYWSVPNDDNRIQDSLDLRVLFLNGRPRKLSLDKHVATLLEILVSLSHRVEFTAGGSSRRWAWKLLKNLRLTQKPDPLTKEDRQIIHDILDALIWRTYRRDGFGGFFPLKYPEEDQTKVEIWYQMNKYVIEKSLL